MILIFNALSLFLLGVLLPLNAALPQPRDLGVLPTSTPASWPRPLPLGQGPAEVSEAGTLLLTAKGPLLTDAKRDQALPVGVKGWGPPLKIPFLGNLCGDGQRVWLLQPWSTKKAQKGLLSRFLPGEAGQAKPLVVEGLTDPRSRGQIVSILANICVTRSRGNALAVLFPLRQRFFWISPQGRILMDLPVAAEEPVATQNIDGIPLPAQAPCRPTLALRDTGGPLLLLRHAGRYDRLRVYRDTQLSTADTYRLPVSGEALLCFDGAREILLLGEDGLLYRFRLPAN